jgi:serine/threonine protein phosphatase 1
MKSRQFDRIMRRLVFGDIHGYSVPLQTLLQAVRPGAEDQVITLGDYVDRGPDSKGVLDILLKLKDQTQLIPLLGNHEILFIDALENRSPMEPWLMHGGKETLLSYAPSVEAFDQQQHMPEDHLHFLNQVCRRYYEDDDFIYVHANANAFYAMDEQPDDWLFWTRFEDAYQHVSGKRMLCGHTAQKTGLPLVKPCGMCLDTWIHGQGWLTCYEVETDTFWQANHAGELRQIRLSELPTVS